MRNHPLVMFFTLLGAGWLGTIALHPFFGPPATLPVALIVSTILSFCLYQGWRVSPPIGRFFQRLPHAMRLGVFAWQQQAAMEREEGERLSQEKYRRMYGLPTQPHICEHHAEQTRYVTIDGERYVDRWQSAHLPPDVQIGKFGFSVRDASMAGGWRLAWHEDLIQVGIRKPVETAEEG